MRIILSPIGTPTEIQPLIVLAGALRARGHAITFCVPERYRPWMIKSDFPMFSSGTAFDELITAPPASKKDLESALRRLVAEVPVQFVALRDACKEADLLIGSMLQLAGPSIAERAKIPYVNIVSSPFYLQAGNELPIAHPIATGIMHLLHHRILTRTWKEECLQAINKERNWTHLLPVEDTTKYVFQSGNLLLAFDPELVHVPQMQHATSTVTGSIFPEREESQDPQVEQFLSMGGSGVIYFHLGTQKAGDSHALGNACMDAAKWVKKRAIFSSNWISFDPKAVSADFLVVNALPQDSVLSHCSLLVHDGSAAMTATAVRAGIPQVIVAAYADQMFWAKALESKGLAGTPIFRGTLDSKTFSRAIGDVLSNGAIKAKAKSIGERLRLKSGIVKAVEVIERIVESSPHRI